MSKKYDVCMLGTTCAVGEAMLWLLEQREFSVCNLYPLASSRLACSTVSFHGDDLSVIDVDDIAEAPGVIVMDKCVPGGFWTRVDVAGNDATYAGCIRKDNSHPMGLNLWVVGGNASKGAALNSVQIADIGCEITQVRRNEPLLYKGLQNKNSIVRGLYDQQTGRHDKSLKCRIAVII
jgi:aspartate-semialdehyde dehydrogenase